MEDINSDLFDNFDNHVNLEDRELKRNLLPSIRSSVNLIELNKSTRSTSDSPCLNNKSGKENKEDELYVMKTPSANFEDDIKTHSGSNSISKGLNPISIFLFKFTQ